MKKLLFVFIMMIPVLTLTAQSDDPDVQKAKQETAEVFDLGRFFGYLLVMEQEETSLSIDQMSELYETLERYLKIERIDAEEARETLFYLEEELLTIDQLIYVDELAMEKMATRETGTGKGEGSSEGGSIQSYISGGAFNPLNDDSKTLGQDVIDFRDYLKKKLGK